MRVLLKIAKFFITRFHSTKKIHGSDERFRSREPPKRSRNEFYESDFFFNYSKNRSRGNFCFNARVCYSGPVYLFCMLSLLCRAKTCDFCSNYAICKAIAMRCMHGRSVPTAKFVNDRTRIASFAFALPPVRYSHTAICTQSNSQSMRMHYCMQFRIKCNTH